MKRIAPLFAVLFLGGCAATSPRYIAQKQAEVLTHAEAKCSHVDAPEKHMNCLNRVVRNSGYWGQGMIVIAANDGSPQLVSDYRTPDQQWNIGGDVSSASPR